MIIQEHYIFSQQLPTFLFLEVVFSMILVIFSFLMEMMEHTTTIFQLQIFPVQVHLLMPFTLSTLKIPLSQIYLQITQMAMVSILHFLHSIISQI
jgi:hypothetical protein